MRKIIFFTIMFLLSFSLLNADYLEDSINSFKNSPSAKDLENIQDPDLRYCEETFLKAYMRREFTKEENDKCRDIFSSKIEAELNYKTKAMQERGVY